MQRHSWWILLILILLFRLFFYFDNSDKLPDGTKVRITTRVSSEPIRYERSQRLVLEGYVVYLPLYPSISYGDRVVVEGIVGDETLVKANLVQIKESRKLLHKIRKRLITFYQSSLPTRHAGLISGIAIGSKSGLDGEFWEKLKDTGTAHVVVASGMNVTLVASFLVNLFVSFWSRKRAVVMAIAGIWIYAVIAGFDAPIVRAAIMGSLAFSAQKFGRLHQSWRILFISALAMLIVKPGWITDLGFILSFVATTSLMLFEPKVDRLIHYIPSIIREGLATSIAAQIGVSPIIYATFGQFNLLSPLVNGLVLWTIPYITVVGILAGTLGLFWDVIGRMMLYAIYPLTSWFILIIETFS